MFGFIKRWSLALRWWTVFTMMNVGIVLMYLTGLFENIYQIDFTRISFAILALCYGFTINNGINVYKACKKETMDKKDIINFCQKNEPGWFMSDVFLTLGMIGTVLGFIVAFMFFKDIDPSNMIALKSTLLSISTGMGAALYTTATGLIAGLILKIQLFDFDHYLDRINEICGCGVDYET